MSLFATRRARTATRSWRRGIAVIAAGTLLFGCQAAAQGAPSISRAPRSAPATPTEVAFALALLRTLAGGETTNLVVSPTSLESGLAMLELGSRGATEAGIARSLQASGLTPDTLAASIGALRTSLTSADDISLSEADAVFTRTGFYPRSTYLATLQRDFATSLHAVAFASDPPQAVASINDFVSTATHGRVPVLFPSPLDRATLLVLVDAVYLDAKWATPFPHGGTATSAFHLASGATVQVPFMNIATDDVTTESEAGLTALALPYQGKRFQALLLEPTTTSLATFISGLTPNHLTAILNALRPQLVGVALPTVDIANSSDLNATLTRLGMGNAFSNEADLSGIVAMPRLRVTTVRQVATLQIDEAGTVAAAATGVGLAPTAIAVPRRIVRIDHPFVVLIRDSRTGAVLFTGIVANPSQHANT